MKASGRKSNIQPFLGIKRIFSSFQALASLTASDFDLDPQRQDIRISKRGNY